MEDNEFEEACIISHTESKTRPTKIAILSEAQFEIIKSKLKVQLVERINPDNKELTCKDSRLIPTLRHIQQLVAGLPPTNLRDRPFCLFGAVAKYPNRYLLSTGLVTQLVDVRGGRADLIVELQQPCQNLVPWGTGLLLFKKNQPPTFFDLGTLAEQEIKGAPPVMKQDHPTVCSSSTHVHYLTRDYIMSIDKDLKVGISDELPTDMERRENLTSSERSYKNRLGYEETEGFVDFFYCPKTRKFTSLFFEDLTNYIKKGDDITPVVYELDKRRYNVPKLVMLKKMYSDHFLVSGYLEGNDHLQMIHLWHVDGLEELDRLEYDVGYQLDYPRNIRLLSPRKGLNCFLLVSRHRVGLFCEYRLKLYLLHTLDEMFQFWGQINYLRDGLWVSAYHDFPRQHSVTVIRVKQM